MSLIGRAPPPPPVPRLSTICDRHDELRLRILFHPELPAVPRGPDDEYPLILTTARLEEHYNTGTMSRRSPTLNSADD